MSIHRRLDKIEDDPDARYFLLRDGTKYWYRPRELYKSFFLFWEDCLVQDYGHHPRDPVPEIFHALANAGDRVAALEQVAPGWRKWRTEFTPKSAIDLDI